MRFLNSIKKKIAVVLLLVFLPFIVNMALVFSTLSMLGDDGKAINISGSQRMRTMLLGLYTVKYLDGVEVGNSKETSEAKELLNKELATYRKFMNALIDGDSDLEISKNKDAEITAKLKQAKSHTDQYADRVEAILKGKNIESNRVYIVGNALNVKNEINEVVKMYQEAYDKKIDNLKYMEVIILIAGAIILICGIIIASKGIVIPIRIVTAKLKDIANGEGDLTEKVEVKSHDEIGQLAKHFNDFVDKIADLVKRIDETGNVLLQSSENLSHTTEQTVTSNEGMTATIVEISDGALQQAHDIEISANMVMDFGRQIEDILNNSRNMKDQSSKTEEINNSSLQTMHVLNLKNKENMDVTKQISMVISQLYGQVEEINKFVEIIHKIAEQTNLLALNAAIEAARAGEQGKGFSVVAEEVRQLAEESRESTKGISSIVESIINQIIDTKDTMAKVGGIAKEQSHAVEETEKSFNDISVSVEKTIAQIEEINTSILEMDKNKDKIIDSVQSVAAISEETAAATQEVSLCTQEQHGAIEEITASSVELNQIAKNLKGLVSKFKY